ncbi:MAG TPA: undecaprenyldiphospho-muramoylpentapeptide beta-N-acetylglucosaminyltransferase [Actinomycetota bacterium]|nr:undecaprenyldiphospho-muramoylpentapeptide beta-N-acetylglucosaminyltransferase [Actinomycetota bacterium]
MPTSIVIAGGGTGGHVYPGLALAEALRARRPDAAISFIGTERGLEMRAVPAAGFELDTIAVLPWAKTLGARRYLAPATALRATVQAMRILRRRRAQVVVSMGGYASLPAALAARLNGVPIVVHEQNAVPGRANRITARLTRRVAATFAESAAAFPRPSQVRVTGNPIRESLARLDRDALRPEAFLHFGLDPGKTTVVVTGGSQGAKRLSEAARSLAASWAGDHAMQILLIAGRGNASDAAPGPIREIEFTDRMDLVYAAADLVVCRSGAGIMEVAAAGVPAIMVPYPYARDDHQRANAAALERARAGIIIDETEASPERLAALIREIAGDPARRGAMAAAARAYARPDAAAALAAMVLDAAEKGPSR